MIRSPRWGVLSSLLIAATSLALIGAPAPEAGAVTGCFSISMTNDERMAVPELNEASGLVLSRQMPGVMWTHNDDDPNKSDAENNRIYAVNETGDLLATVQFNLLPGDPTVPDSKFYELEDISFGPGPSGEPNYLYLGDTGDNNPTREYAAVYRFPEPVFTPDPDNPITINVSESALDGTRFEYQSYQDPDLIKPRNVEGIFMDPGTGHLFLFEKGLHAIDENGDLADSSGLPRLYSFVYKVRAADLFPSNVGTVRLATVETYVRAKDVESVVGISGADISVDGSIIAIKNTEETFYWHRDPTESVITTFENDHEAPCQGPSGMKGEALAISPTNDRMVMIREGQISPIWQAVFTNQDHECFGQAATILGTSGDDVITGTSGDDVIVTFGGDDHVVGADGSDRICLGPGEDTAIGGKRRDRIDGGPGDDEIRGNKGNDILKGGTGADLVIGSENADTLYGGSGKDTILGGAAGDTVFGGDGADIIKGAGSSDSLSGGLGGDSIVGGNGNDSLAGGGGQDSCNGGGGSDTATSCEDVTGVP
ncbi:MAG: hypothetical protein HKN91_04260 [Acidimicrobiia bacterium]|nr:hypothetical protein [Acidimicrobiia bacterium]